MSATSEQIEKHDIFTDTQGIEWRIDRILKIGYSVTCISTEGYGTKTKVQDIHGWRKHTLPKSLKVGDVLLHHGERVKVTSFCKLGWQQMVGITGRWGFEEGHE